MNLHNTAGQPALTDLTVIFSVYQDNLESNVKPSIQEQKLGHIDPMHIGKENHRIDKKEKN